MEDKGIRRLIIAVGLLIVSLLTGIIGFNQMEGYTLTDAFYMTVITFSTVGYGEVEPLSQQGRIFASFYIILNLGIFGYVVSVITRYFFEGELRQLFRQFIRGKEVKKVKDHTIVVGFGRNGRKACEELERSEKEFVIIECNDERLDKIPDRLAKKSIHGDATQDETLKRAGLEKAKAIITTLPNDAENVFITLTAKGLNESIFVVSRASEEKSVIKLRRAGADKVVMPDALGGIHMAHEITKPYVNEFLELFTGMGNEQLKLEEFPCDEFKAEFMDKPISQLGAEDNTGVSIVGFKDKNEGFKFRPGPNTHIGLGDIIIILGEDEEIDLFRKNYIRAL